MVWESERQVTSPKYTFRFALAGTNAVGVVRVLCKKNREKGPLRCCHFCRNEAVIVGSAAFFMPVSFACCGHPTVVASEFCVRSLLSSQETHLCLQMPAHVVHRSVSQHRLTDRWSVGGGPFKTDHDTLISKTIL